MPLRSLKLYPKKIKPLNSSVQYSVALYHGAVWQCTTIAALFYISYFSIFKCCSVELLHNATSVSYRKQVYTMVDKRECILSLHISQIADERSLRISNLKFSTTTCK
jgi:hypothetical protein